jgi:uroporphyrinogen-III synthase
LTLPVLILRPEPGASATAVRAKALDLTPHLMPLFDIQPMAWSPRPAENFDAVLVTSANAMRHGGHGLSTYFHLPVLAVGEASADAARDAGFDNVLAGEGDGATLIELAKPAGYQRLLHLCGRNHRRLTTPNCAITAVHVYTAKDADPAPNWPFSAQQAAVALAHSPRAAASFSQIVPDRGLIHLVTISPAASAAAGTGWRSNHAAPIPNDAAMLAIAARICEQEK